MSASRRRFSQEFQEFQEFQDELAWEVIDTSKPVVDVS